MRWPILHSSPSPNPSSSPLLSSLESAISLAGHRATPPPIAPSFLGLCRLRLHLWHRDFMFYLVLTSPSPERQRHHKPDSANASFLVTGHCFAPRCQHCERLNPCLLSLFHPSLVVTMAWNVGDLQILSHCRCHRRRRGNHVVPPQRNMGAT